MCVIFMQSDEYYIQLNQVDQFKYLMVTFSEEGGSETAVRARVKAGWQKWKELGQ